MARRGAGSFYARAADEDRRGNIEFMSTILFSSPIFGPVHSRRLGVSLGVNL